MPKYHGYRVLVRVFPKTNASLTVHKLLLIAHRSHDSTPHPHAKLIVTTLNCPIFLEDFDVNYELLGYPHDNFQHDR
jgi:hypothetical protein